MGVFPSLEVLPVFAEFLKEGSKRPFLPFAPKALSCYGEISRNLLTRKLVGGIIPWEIFVKDVLSLPGQRNQWHVPMFLQACPTELVLRESIYRALHPAKGGAAGKLPARLTLGVESSNSLTKYQFVEWLKQWKGAASVQITYRMLPMGLMAEALAVEAIDAMIAPAPWGIHAEAAGIARRDTRFTPGKFVQQLAMVCQREFLGDCGEVMKSISETILLARKRLSAPAEFEAAVRSMARSGSPLLSLELLEKARALYQFDSFDQDLVPDAESLAAELARLAALTVLPSQISPIERTARLLAHA